MEVRTGEPFILLINELLKMNKRIPVLFQGVEAASGLSRMQMTVLASIAESRRPLTVAQLGRDLGHPRQVIQRATNDLTDGGLIALMDNPRHKRARILVLTRRGAQLKKRSDEYAAQVAKAMARFVDDDAIMRVVGGLQQIRFAVDGLIAQTAPIVARELE